MLILTDAAAAALRSLMGQGELSPGGGVRLVPCPPGEPSPLPVVEVASTLIPGDAVVIDHGIRIFLDPRLVPLDDDLAIDARTDEQDQVVFVLRGLS
jgi:Fe-S cluster assembly iron-binding protein IscA